MLQYILRRFLLMIPTLFVISLVSFIVMQLPPGDFLTTYIASMAEQDGMVDEALVAALRHRYGLDQPQYVRYLKWIGNIMQGEWGRSLEWDRPVKELIGTRIFLTFVISLTTLLIGWIIAFPVGIYSAIRQYSVGDYVFTAISFIGRGIPNFLLALVVMYIIFKVFKYNPAGLFSREFQEAPWSWAKVLDLFKHLWVPVFVISVGSTAGLIRTMRANLLDELNKPYVVTARSKGLTERKLIFKYPVRVALNPFVSTVGWALPGLISGTTIVSIVLGLQTTGPLMLRALQSQDMYLAGSFLLLLSALTVIGTFISDILLAWLDPRIRLTG
ncbi:MAG: ABC transporter permease [Anaerolineae bacterium]|nr:ABC transporter permease [Anaerolineae bacterium]